MIAEIVTKVQSITTVGCTMGIHCWEPPERSCRVRHDWKSRSKHSRQYADAFVTAGAQV